LGTACEGIKKNRLPILEACPNKWATLERFQTIRGSVSNGFHAPCLQQRFYSATSTLWRNINGVNVPLILGTFRNNSDIIARNFGVPLLTAEKAVNLSGGFTARLSCYINLTVDAYWIQMKNRIVFSGVFDKSNPDVSNILAGFPAIDAV
jgi:iron complex outermembrane receptor protein